MIIENTLDLGLAPDDAWRTLLNIPYVAPCLPGQPVVPRHGGD